MNAKEMRVLDFLKPPNQFVIPIFQRQYSWTIGHCERLWRDILRAGGDDTVKGHFLGSIVYVEKGLYQVASVSQLLVIDGQQRLATISLLLFALGRALHQRGVEAEISQKKITNYFLLNREEGGNLRYKLLLTQSDRDTLTRLLDGLDPPTNHSRRIHENYRFFAQEIGKPEADLLTIYTGLTKLTMVQIALDRQYDNPQLIFESLNATGLALTQADLIRNYVLMGLELKLQEELYNEYWHPIEQGFGHTGYDSLFDRFTRDYLTVRTGRIPNVDAVYDAFKAYAQGKADGSVKDIVSDIYRFSKHFVRMALEKEEDKELREAFNDINTLKVDVAYPLLLEIYDDYSGGRISRQDFLAAVRLIESYVFRRAVCGIPTNSLNKTFAMLGKEIDKENYLGSLTAALVLKDSYRRFPTDEEFKRELLSKDLYNFRSRNYWLRKLENRDRKEAVTVEDYTIEHVMPQNENLPLVWRQELGENWQEVHSKYLHTLGNLTLTGYNPELSDRSFVEKRDMKGGFADSPIRLNRDLAELDHWNEEQIRQRAERLADLAATVWRFPRLEPSILDRYRARQKSEPDRVYTLADYPQLTGDMLNLFEHLRRRILNLDSSVTEQVLKLYIAYKTTTNFVDVIPQKKGLRLSLKIEFDKVRDPKGLCRDISKIGRWGTGDVDLKLTSIAQLDDVMDLVRQAFERQTEYGD